jgi:hypothetical protein
MGGIISDRDAEVLTAASTFPQLSLRFGGESEGTIISLALLTARQ